MLAFTRFQTTVPQTSNRKSIEIIINQLLTLLLWKKVGVKACILPKNVVSLHRQSKELPFVPRSGLLLRPARVINDGRRRSSMKPRGSKVKRSARSLRSLSSKRLLRVKVIKGHYRFRKPLWNINQTSKKISRQKEQDSEYYLYLCNWFAKKL